MNRLAEWLAERDMTQGEFAKEIGADQAQVSRYVRYGDPDASGASAPSQRVRRAIAEATKGKVPVESWDRLKPRGPRRLRHSSV